jgi:hypothetical protein
MTSYAKSVPSQVGSKTLATLRFLSDEKNSACEARHECSYAVIFAGLFTAH